MEDDIFELIEEYDNDGVKRILGDKNFNINQQCKHRNITPLICACTWGGEAMVKLLLARLDIDVNLCDDQCRGPLTYAVGWCMFENVKLLLAHPEIDVNQQDNLGSTALEHAATWDYSDIINLLLARSDVNVNLQDIHHMTILMNGGQMGVD